VLGLESTNSRMSRNGKNELLLKRHRSLDEIIQQIDDVTMEGVNNMANTIFTEQCSFSLISPEGEFPKGLI
jgi:predicted Zn-dependent peptidase